jgi:hypothetical protein
MILESFYRRAEGWSEAGANNVDEVGVVLLRIRFTLADYTMRNDLQRTPDPTREDRRERIQHNP